MSMTLSGSFLSIDGVKWGVEIFTTANLGAKTDTNLIFDGAEPLKIEFKDTPIESVVRSSAATIRLLSPSDRLFTSLFTATPRSTRLTVFRYDTPTGPRRAFWQGYLEPELYEEPFERDRDYVVTLTFTDLGALDREKFSIDPATLCTLHQIINHCLSAATYYTLTDGAYNLEQITIPAANFYDEDSEPMSRREVLESVLQPLGLAIIQKAKGYNPAFLIFDLPTLMQQPTEAVNWWGDASTLTMEPVYNAISIDFDPYADTKQIDANGADTKIAKTDVERQYRFSAPGADGYAGFTLTTASKATESPFTVWKADARHFRIDSIYSGSDTGGVALRVYNPMNNIGLIAGYDLPWAFHRDDDGNYDYLGPAFWTEPTRLHSIARTPAGTNNWLRLKLSMLLDARYNPFEPPSRTNEEGDYKRQKDYWRKIFVPIRLWIVADDGRTFHYHNRPCVEETEADLPQAEKTSPSDFRQSWQLGEGVWGDAWLCYYNWDFKESPCNGFITNRQIISAHHKTVIPDFWQKRGDGQFIPPPPYQGKLYFQVGGGVAPCLESECAYRGAGDKEYNAKGVPMANWLLFNSASLEVVDNYGRVIESEDITYTTEALAAAADPLEIQTTSGAMTTRVAGGRGMFNFSTVAKTYADDQTITATPEEHTLSALASQYAFPRPRLSGVIKIPADYTAPLTEPASPSQRFFVTSLILNPREDTAEAQFTQILPFTYHPAKE